MTNKPLYDETTTIEPLSTITEIHTYLVRMGALFITTSYDETTQEPTGVHFRMRVGGIFVPYQLPARVEPIFKILNADNQGSGDTTMIQAKRVAWRQIFQWVQAQLAIVETGMVESAEVFMPFIQTGPQETLYQRAVSNGFQKLLPSTVEPVE